MRAAHPRRTISPFTSLAMPQLHEPTSGLWRYVGISPHRPTSMRTSSVAWCPARACTRTVPPSLPIADSISSSRSRRRAPARRRRRWRRAGGRLLPRSRYWIPSRARPSSRADPPLLLVPVRPLGHARASEMSKPRHAPRPSTAPRRGRDVRVDLVSTPIMTPRSLYFPSGQLANRYRERAEASTRLRTGAGL
jgi:hypothetical protein